MSRPSAYLSKQTSQNKYNTSLTRSSNSVHDNPTTTRPPTTIHDIPTISRPSYSPDEVLNILAHFIAINSHPEVKDMPNIETRPEAGPYLSAPTVSSELSESSKPTSESQKSTNTSPDDTETDTDSTSSDDTQSTTSQTSTASNRTLRPRIPISYNETLLKCLHGRPQIKTLNNLSIPLPDSSDEDTEETDEHTQDT